MLRGGSGRAGGWTRLNDMVRGVVSMGNMDQPFSKVVDKRAAGREGLHSFEHESVCCWDGGVTVGRRGEEAGEAAQQCVSLAGGGQGMEVSLSIPLLHTRRGRQAIVGHVWTCC